jgi:hypothetical protein
MGRRSSVALGSLLALCGCNDLFGVGDLRFTEDGSGGSATGGIAGMGGMGGEVTGGGGADPCLGDADRDGVDDCRDACAGSDDSLDADGDGEPDGCDDCPVDGPVALPMLPVAFDGITISSLSVDGGSHVEVVSAGSTVELSIGYEITDCRCAGCVDQIEVGLVPAAGPSLCAYNGVPGCVGMTDIYQGPLTVPDAPGVYMLRFGKGQDFDCGVSWWSGEPPAAQTIGALCVQ